MRYIRLTNISAGVSHDENSILHDNDRCGSAVALLGGRAISAQDKYTLKVPGGLSLSEFRGYEGWQVVATSQNDKLVAVIPLIL
jgi:hypothetical protein